MTDDNRYCVLSQEYIFAMMNTEYTIRLVNDHGANMVCLHKKKSTLKYKLDKNIEQKCCLFETPPVQKAFSSRYKLANIEYLLNNTMQNFDNTTIQTCDTPS